MKHIWDSSYLGIQLDESTDRRRGKHLIVYMSFLCSNTPVTEFYAHLTLEQCDAATLQASCSATLSPHMVADEDECYACKKEGAVVDDMVKLAYLHEPCVMHNLMQRYQRNLIYTYTGSILTAANPFMRLLSIYDRDVRDAYRGKPLGELSPYVFAIADNAYRWGWRGGGAGGVGWGSDARGAVQPIDFDQRGDRGGQDRDNNGGDGIPGVRGGGRLRVRGSAALKAKCWR
ncbi:unnamed protein product [Closterium sp. NIES-53]